MRSIDLNCDMGEGCGNDHLLLELVSSANVACGYHAGDRETMRRTAAEAARRGVAVGAHPSFPDRENFGRTEMSMSPREVFEIVVEQILAMKEVCESEGTRLRHVKPHGALYNQAARHAELAAAIAEAVGSIDRDVVLFGLSGSRLIEAGRAAGLKTASEAFADRTYSPDGSLTPRSRADALIRDPAAAAAQAVRIVESSEVVATTGDMIEVSADTICIHGDGPHAVEFAGAIRSALIEGGVNIRPVSK